MKMTCRAISRARRSGTTPQRADHVSENRCRTSFSEKMPGGGSRCLTVR
ncbi:MAG: hypothetical protein HZB31_01035 [Nitrospirae bacterium]|nr:hypothetical protein [Nitrospirota bacterium]